MRDRKLVVAGLIVGADGRILITQRRADQALPLQWEFPGGKVEPGEAPVAALARELREEIGVGVTVGRVWDVLFHAYPAFDLVMLVYSCRILDGEVPQSVEVADLAWVPPGELPGWDILPADRPLVNRLIAEGSPDLIPSRGGAYNSPDMEGRAKVTKEVLCEEARFILANVMAEARYGRQNRYDDIRRVCEGAVSIPFSEYIGFLEKSGYLRHDRANESLEVTPEGETVVNGGNLAEFTERAVSHFKKLRQSRAMAVPAAAVPMGTQSGAMSSSAQPMVRSEASGANPLPRKEPKPMTTSGGRPSAMAGGEIMSAGDMDNRYEKLVTIGSGGMGTVYRARQVALNREVALKEIRDLFGFFSEDQRNEIVRRFTDVVRAWGNLAHPNILPIHDVNLYSEYPNLITELAPNGSCRRLINDAEEIPVELVFKYLLQTLHALRAGHAQRVYHRGLKPEQLLIDGYGNVKVSDFGFTRIVERDHAVIRQIYVGMGNVAYMAPELYSDPMMSGPQTDIYALGIIFYELLTRKLPGRRSPMPSQLNPTLPKGIDDIFDQMTRDARNERYATVDDILDDIDKLEGMESVLGSGDRVLVGDSPLSNIKFRPGAEEPLAGTPIEEGGDGDDKGSSRRPYSFQQRRNKKI